MTWKSKMMPSVISAYDLHRDETLELVRVAKIRTQVLLV